MRAKEIRIGGVYAAGSGNASPDHSSLYKVQILAKVGTDWKVKHLGQLRRNAQNEVEVTPRAGEGVFSSRNIASPWDTYEAKQREKAKSDKQRQDEYQRERQKIIDSRKEHTTAIRQLVAEIREVTGVDIFASESNPKQDAKFWLDRYEQYGYDPNINMKNLVALVAWKNKVTADAEEARLRDSVLATLEIL